MNLIIDVGNSIVKLAVFKQEKIILKNKISLQDLQNKIYDITKEFKNIEKAIISSVGNLKKMTLALLKNTLRYLY
jgi:type III pantothenate kinase